MNSASSPIASETARLVALREARFKWSLLTSFLTKPLAVALPAITVPLFLHYLGPEKYGLYETVVALAAWLGLTNLGLGLGLMNRLTDCFVAEDRGRAQRYTSTLFLATAALLVLFAVLLLATVPFIHWRALFRTEAQLSHWSLAGLVGLTASISLLTVFTGNLSPIYSAYQELTRYNLWDGAGKLLSLAACFLVVKTPLGLGGVVIAATGVPALVVRLADAQADCQRGLLFFLPADGGSGGLQLGQTHSQRVSRSGGGDGLRNYRPGVSNSVRSVDAVVDAALAGLRRGIAPGRSEVDSAPPQDQPVADLRRDGRAGWTVVVARGGAAGPVAGTAGRTEREPGAGHVRGVRVAGVGGLPFGGAQRRRLFACADGFLGRAGVVERGAVGGPGAGWGCERPGLGGADQRGADHVLGLPLDDAPVSGCAPSRRDPRPDRALE